MRLCWKKASPRVLGKKLTCRCYSCAAALVSLQHPIDGQRAARGRRHLRNQIRHGSRPDQGARLAQSICVKKRRSRVLFVQYTLFPVGNLFWDVFSAKYPDAGAGPALNCVSNWASISSSTTESSAAFCPPRPTEMGRNGAIFFSFIVLMGGERLIARPSVTMPESCARSLFLKLAGLHRIFPVHFFLRSRWCFSSNFQPVDALRAPHHQSTGTPPPSVLLGCFVPGRCSRNAHIPDRQHPCVRHRQLRLHLRVAEQKPRDSLFGAKWNELQRPALHLRDGPLPAPDMGLQIVSQGTAWLNALVSFALAHTHRAPPRRRILT